MRRHIGKKNYIYKKLSNLDFSLVSIKTLSASEDSQCNVPSVELKFILLLDCEDWRRKGPCSLAGDTGRDYICKSFHCSLPREGLSCNISFKSHREIFGCLPKSRTGRLKRRGRKEETIWKEHAKLWWTVRRCVITAGSVISFFLFFRSWEWRGSGGGWGMQSSLEKQGQVYSGLGNWGHLVRYRPKVTWETRLAVGRHNPSHLPS